MPVSAYNAGMAEIRLKSKNTQAYSTIFLAILCYELLSFTILEIQRIFESDSLLGKQVTTLMHAYDESYLRTHLAFIPKVDWLRSLIYENGVEQPDFHQEDFSPTIVTDRTVVSLSGTSTSTQTISGMARI